MEGSGRGLDLKLHPGIDLEGLRKNTIDGRIVGLRTEI
jgi:hypothetical protein